jgi:hypothetical protein
MPDHVAATLIVHALPRSGARAVMELIVDQGLVNGEDDAETGVLLGVPYCAHDWAAGALDHIEGVFDGIPTASWTAWYDPDSDGLGELRRFVPGLGMFRAACDEDGDTVFYAKKIKAAVTAGLVGTPGTLTSVQPLHDPIGQKWVDAIDAMGSTAKLRVTPPPVYEVLWDRRTGIVEIEPATGGNEIELQGPISTHRIGKDPRERSAVALRIEEFLREQGWVRTDEDWTTMARHRLWSTAAYRLADVTEVSA